MSKTEIATTKEQLPSTDVDLFGDMAGEGLENVTADDLLIPRLSILQQLSPQLNKKKPEFIEGAEEGDIADLGLGTLFKEGVIFLPVLFRKEYLEWAPRSTGKGLIAVHSDPAVLDACTRDEKNRPITAEGNLIAETAQFYGLNLSAGRQLSFIPMTSTQLKKSRRWNSMATGEKLKRADGSEFTPPMFYRTYKLTSAEESNNEGEWSGWRIERGLTLVEYAKEVGIDPAQLLSEAKDFLKSLQKGEAKGDLSDLDGNGGGAGGSRDPDSEAM